jgi:hypothetical protein
MIQSRFSSKNLSGLDGAGDRRRMKSNQSEYQIHQPQGEQDD